MGLVGVLKRYFEDLEDDTMNLSVKVPDLKEERQKERQEESKIAHFERLDSAVLDHNTLNLRLKTLEKKTGDIMLVLAVNMALLVVLLVIMF